eukprot:TRINITY_DN3757_c1_g1_i1.p1 TRINITY_DN3757_c1_g1~~TRINITY_DN3757_c1_g1_i1.p1  ORF type:complete len:314 (+),score=41.16 TRINITY_DN3757_c1_g1_i1:61-1002(+)
MAASTSAAVATTAAAFAGCFAGVFSGSMMLQSTQSKPLVEDETSSSDESSLPRARRMQRRKRQQAAQSQPEPMEAGWQGFSMAEARELADTTHKEVALKSPSEVLADLQKGNMRFWTGAARRPERSAFERRALISKQFPLVAVLGCSDSRVPTEIVFDVGLGDLFVSRVAGNCLDTTTLASLLYAVNHLKVKVLMVLGHEACGAVKAAGLPSSAISKEPRALSTLLTSLKGGLEHARLQDIQDQRAYDREAVVTNIKRQIEHLSADENIMGKISSGDLIVVGGFYEMSSGIVDFFSEINASTTQISSLQIVSK